jgi:hypothetical protein
MDMEYSAPEAFAAEVLDRILDKGIRVEAPRVMSEAGLGQISAVARVRVLRAETHLEHTRPDQASAHAA